MSYMHRKHNPQTVKQKIAMLKAFSHYLILQDELETEEQGLPKTIPIDIIRNILVATYTNYKAITAYSQNVL